MKPYFLRGGIIVSASRPDGLWDQPHCGCIIWAAGSAASQPYRSVWLFPLKISSVRLRTWPWPGTLYFRALFDKGHFTATFPLYKLWLKQFVTTWTFPQLFFSPNHVELSGSLGGFCFHREFATHSAKPTTTSACGKISYKWLSLLWTGCIPGHPASTLSQPIWWHLAKTRYCREKVCNHQGLKGCFREDVPSPAPCVFPVVLLLKLKSARDSCACLCNKRATKVERKDSLCKGDPSSFFSSFYVKEFKSTASITLSP